MFLDISHAIHVATLVLSGCNCSWLPMIIIHYSYILTNFPLSQLSHNLFSAIDAYLYGSLWWTSFIILPRHHRQYPHPQVHRSFRSCFLFFRFWHFPSFTGGPSEPSRSFLANIENSDLIWVGWNWPNHSHSTLSWVACGPYFLPCFIEGQTATVGFQ